MKVKGKILQISKRGNTALFESKDSQYWITKVMVDFPEVINKEIVLDLPKWLVKS